MKNSGHQHEVDNDINHPHEKIYITKSFDMTHPSTLRPNTLNFTLLHEMLSESCLSLPLCVHCRPMCELLASNLMYMYYGAISKHKLITESLVLPKSLLYVHYVPISKIRLLHHRPAMCAESFIVLLSAHEREREPFTLTYLILLPYQE